MSELTIKRVKGIYEEISAETNRHCLYTAEGTLVKEIIRLAKEKFPDDTLIRSLKPQEAGSELVRGDAKACIRVILDKLSATDED